MAPNPTDNRLIDDVLGAGAQTEESLGRIGERLSQHVLDAHREGSYPREVVRTLARLASSEDADDRRAGATLIFGYLVERLSDSFDPDLAGLYDAIFATIIDEQRRRPEGRLLDAALERFGLGSEEQIRDRRARLRAAGVQPLTSKSLRKAVVLSRVTIGADVAITSVILRTITRAWPEAEVVLVGSRRVGELFAGDRRIEVLEVPYPRRGTLIDRLGAWVDLLAAIDRTTAGLASEEVLFVDPDSRLTQLGLLPLTEHEAACRIFESRSFDSGNRTCLGQLAAVWAGATFPLAGEPAAPWVDPGPHPVELGRRAVARLRGAGPGRVVAVSYGVGGNPAKRAGSDFEARLLASLLSFGHRIVLDLGVKSDRAANDTILGPLEAREARIVRTNEETIGEVAVGEDAGVLAWDGGPGVFAALIAACDFYIGYDSAFQHIAAALGVPVLAVVLGSPNALFRDRWKPCSSGPVRVISPAGDGDGPDADGLLGETLAAVDDMLNLT